MHPQFSASMLSFDTSIVESVKVTFDFVPRITVPFKVFNKNRWQRNVLFDKPSKKPERLIIKPQSPHFALTCSVT
jgi:hypothetical protein